jgi:hypothetical protein
MPLTKLHQGTEKADSSFIRSPTLEITFVTFHIDASNGTDVGIVHPNTNLRLTEYLDMIDLMFRSARLFHPGCRCVILSNRKTDLSLLSSRYEISVHDANPASLMLDRTRAMADFVKQFDFTGPLIFIDSDILLNSSLNRVCEKDFDVALTYRDRPMPPINGGLVLVNSKRPAACIDFFSRFLALYSEKYAGGSAWYGDQEALYDLIGPQHFEKRQNDVIDVKNCRVLLLPCDQYNFSPGADVSEIASSLRERSIIHFKGGRKFLMPMFWDAYLGPRERLNLQTASKAILTHLKLWQSRIAK